MSEYIPIERKNYSFYKWIHTTDDLDDFIYVGNTSNITRRKQQHKSNCKNINSKSYNTELYKKMREYGYENFKMVILGTADNITKREAEKIEEEYRVAEKANLNMNRCYTTHEQKIEQHKLWYIKQATEYNEKQKLLKWICEEVKKKSQPKTDFTEEHLKKVSEEVKKLKPKTEFTEEHLKKVKDYINIKLNMRDCGVMLYG